MLQSQWQKPELAALKSGRFALNKKLFHGLVVL
jgi:hypothetical protein